MNNSYWKDLGARNSATTDPPKNNLLWWLLGGLGFLFVCFAVLGITGVGYAAVNEESFKAFSQSAPSGIQPVLVALQPTPTELPDVEKAEDIYESSGADSQCNPANPFITFKALVGTKLWFDGLPKEGESGGAFCVNISDYNKFLKAEGTYKGGILDGQRLSGLEVLSNFYSYASVGNTSRVDELKIALNNIEPAKVNGKVMKDTGWVKLPGYKKLPKATPQPLCPSGDCFKVTPPANSPTPGPSSTPLKPMQQITSTLTPMPTSMFTPTPPYVDAVLVPELVVVTPQPQVEAAMSNVTPEQWLLLYESAREYHGRHCQHIYNGVDLRTLSSHELWAYTTELAWTNGQFGWQFWANNRRDVYVPGYGNYVIWPVCGQVTNMPDVNNIDGNGTSWRTSDNEAGGIAVYYPPGIPDSQTGLIHIGDTYYVNAYGIWFAPAYPKPGPLDDPIPTISLMDAITWKKNGLFADWHAVNAEYPTAGKPAILMTSIRHDHVYIDFSAYISHINQSASSQFWVLDCDSQYALENGGFQIASNPLDGGWCISPGLP